MKEFKRLEKATSGQCPKCGTDDIEYGTLELDGNSLYYPMKCNCGFEGREYYNIEFDGIWG